MSKPILNANTMPEEMQKGPQEKPEQKEAPKKAPEDAAKDEKKKEVEDKHRDEKFLEKAVKFKNLLEKVKNLNDQQNALTKKERFDVKNKDIQKQLEQIVGYLNQKLNLGLQNISLDIHPHGDNLEIHYWESRKAGDSSATHDITILIDKDFKVTKTTKELATGKITAE